MVESPLFIPKKKKSVSDLGQSEESEKQITYSGQTEPYENVIISPYNSKFYTPRPLHLGVNGMSHQYNLLTQQHAPIQNQPVKQEKSQQIQLINQQGMNQQGTNQHGINQHGINQHGINQHGINLAVVPPRTRANSGGKRQREPYENLEHVQYLSQYPRRQLVRYVPQRTAPQPPQPPCRGWSPGQADTSGYSSYEQNTLSLNRGPGSPPPALLPTMSEEMDHQAFLHPPVIPGYPHLTLPDQTLANHPTMSSYHHPTLTSHQPNTLDRSHHKFMMNQAVLRQYFCIALTTCIMCPPCGYWSLYQAFKVDDMIDRDNFLGAERLARKIKRYSIIIMVVGVFWVSLTVAIFFLLLNKFKDWFAFTCAKICYHYWICLMMLSLNFKCFTFYF